MKVSEFVFTGNNSLISICGTSGSGKTSISLQIIKELKSGVYFSPSLQNFYGRVEKIIFGPNIKFSIAYTTIHLINGIIKSISDVNSPKILVVDPINRYYRQTRNEVDIILPLNLLKRIAEIIKVVITWDMPLDKRIESRLLWKYSDEVFFLRNNYIFGRNKKCKYSIGYYGVEICT
ncbi:MAG: hypothetical protein QXV69_05065 [Sulfolobaceae archaeon]